MLNRDDIKEMLSITTDDGTFDYYVVCRLSTGKRDYIALAPQFGNNTEIQLFRCSKRVDGLQVSNIESSMELDDVKREYAKVMMNERTELLKKDNVDTVVTIKLDDGTETVCDILGIFDFESADYVAVMPIDRPDETNVNIGLYGYTAVEDDKNEVIILLSTIPTYLFPRVLEYFMEMVNLDDNSVL